MEDDHQQLKRVEKVEEKSTKSVWALNPKIRSKALSRTTNFGYIKQ